MISTTFLKIKLKINSTTIPTGTGTFFLILLKQLLFMFVHTQTHSATPTHICISNCVCILTHSSSLPTSPTLMHSGLQASLESNSTWVKHFPVQAPVQFSRLAYYYVLNFISSCKIKSNDQPSSPNDFLWLIRVGQDCI